MSTLGVASVDASPTAPRGAQEHPGGVMAGVRRRLRAPSRFDGVFTPFQRRLGVLWVCLGVPTVAVWALAFAGSAEGYIFVFTFFASGTFTAPALVVGFFSVRNGPSDDKVCHVLWYVGLVLTFATGVFMLAGLGLDWRFANALGVPVVVLITVALMAAVVTLVRRCSGLRALSVDLIEGVIVMVVVVAPCALLWGPEVAAADDAWFALPAACATIALVGATYWAVVLFVRMGSQAGVLEGCGVALAFTGAANAALQAAQGVSGFSLPAVPLLLVHAVCMSMLLLVPLYLPRRSLRGLDRLPPQAQVRSGGLAATLTLVGLPVLLVTTAAVAGELPWAAPFSLGMMALLLVLAAARHLLTVRETRRLYGHLETASEDRRELLAQVMQRADDDRHRVAAELHEQAVSAYASFVSFIQVAAPHGSGRTSQLTGMSTVVRDDLKRHADSLRQLMVAIKPLQPPASGARTLAAPVHAYVDSLYGDAPLPRLQVSVADGLVLDWVSETVALRIIQEALRNVWAHSRASHVDVSVSMGEDGRSLQVTVVDDGLGFDPAENLFESGIAAMRAFAGVVEGKVVVDSAVGVGTSVTARFGRSGDGHSGGAPVGREPDRPWRRRSGPATSAFAAAYGSPDIGAGGIGAPGIGTGETGGPGPDALEPGTRPRLRLVTSRPSP